LRRVNGPPGSGRKKETAARSAQKYGFHVYFVRQGERERERERPQKDPGKTVSKQCQSTHGTTSRGLCGEEFAGNRGSYFNPRIRRPGRGGFWTVLDARLYSLDTVAPIVASHRRGGRLPEPPHCNNSLDGGRCALGLFEQNIFHG